MCSGNTKTPLQQQIEKLRAANNSPAPKTESVTTRDEEQLELIGDTSEPPKPPTFRDYVEHGWSLCPIREGEKRPRGDKWNRRENAVTDPAQAEHLFNAGLLHSYSGTCAIDIDNYDLARSWLKDKGIDLDALFNADDAVQIVSGDATRGKLIYALPEPLHTKKIMNEDKTITVLEFRCGATTGNSAQDVLPPSTNPRTKKQYQWKYNNELAGTWCAPPPLPEQLKALWQLMVARRVERTSVELAPTARTDELLALIADRDPDLSYDEWCKIGMILHHETEGGDDGLAIWNDWSMQGDKYKGIEDLESHWQSFGNAANPATAGSLRREVVATLADFGPPLDQDVLAQAERAQRDARLAKFRWKPLDDYANQPPPRWLIKKLLPEKPLNMLYGPSGAGKSAITLDMALAITRGIPWRGLNVRQGTVCWFAAEAEGSMRNRSLAYRSAHKVSSLPGFYVIGREAVLTDREAVRALAESAKALSPLLVVVDTLAAASGGANENSAEDMGPVLDNCVVIHEITGASVLLIHHSGKNELAGARGWSGIKARVDAEIEVKKGDNDMRTATPDKMRDGEEGQAFTFKLVQVELGRDEDGDKITSVVVEHVDDRSALQQHNATRKGKGRYHVAIRAALSDAPDSRLEGDDLVIAAVRLVPEDKRPPTVDKQVMATIRQMVTLGELRVVDGYYEVAAPRAVRGNPDRAHVEQLLAAAPTDPDPVIDPDGDLL